MKLLYVLFIFHTQLAYAQFTDDSFLNIGFLDAYDDILRRSKKYAWSSFFFREDGLDNRFREIYFNGFKLNSLFDNKFAWSSLGGLNEVLRNRRDLNWFNTPNRYVSLATAFEVFPKAMRSAETITLSNSSGSYDWRAMWTKNTELSEGSNLLLSIGFRHGEKGQTSGTPYQSVSFLAAYQRKYISFLLSSTWTNRNRSSALTKEEEDLKGGLYNPNWGMLSGRFIPVRGKADSSVRYTFNYSKENLAIGFLAEYQGVVRDNLFYQNAPSPFGNYYKYLPSYHMSEGQSNPYEAERLRSVWRENSEYGQIDFDKIWRQNRRSKQAVYHLSGEVDQAFNLQLLSTFRVGMILFSGRLRLSKQNNYTKLKNLLGASYLLDFNTFFEGEKKYNQLENRLKEFKEGDKIRYSYNASAVEGMFSIHFENSTDNWNWNTDLELSSVQFSRIGNFKNTRSPLESNKRVDSPISSGIRSSFAFLYKGFGRHVVGLNFALESVAPSFNQNFIDARESGGLVEGLKNKKSFRAAFRYQFNREQTKLDLGLKTLILSPNLVKSRFYVQGLYGYINDFVSLEHREFSQIYTSIEWSCSQKIGDSFELSTAGIYGQHRYLDSGFLNIQTAQGESFENIPVYLRGLPVSSGPEKAISFSLNFRASNYFWTELSYHLLWDNYIGYSLLRRSSVFSESGSVNEQFWDINSLDKASFVNLSLGKSWLVNKRYFAVFLSIQNLFNSPIATGGYESSRWGSSRDYNPDIFSNKYWRNVPLRYFINLKYSI